MKEKYWITEGQLKVLKSAAEELFKKLGTTGPIVIIDKVHDEQHISKGAD
jgi:hypothetical protein